MDELKGIEEDRELKRLTFKWMTFVFALAMLFLIVLLLVTSGCVSLSKDIYREATATPIPTTAPTPEPTIEIPEPTPIPVPTESESAFMARTNGYHLREYLHWFKADVEGIQPGPDNTGDLSGWVTVYGYKILPSYHWYSTSWARKFLVKPEDKDNKFLFFFVNEYIDESSVRQYGFECIHFAAHINGRTYYPEAVEYPERRITEFDEIQNYARTSSMQPFGYKIIQDSPSGIFRAEQQDIIYSGRSNAWDGYCMVEIPLDAQPKDITIHGSFANLGGNAWWKLE